MMSVLILSLEVRILVLILEELSDSFGTRFLYTSYTVQATLKVKVKV